MESILNSIKKLLGMTSDYDCFDKDLIIHINTVLQYSRSLVLDPKRGFQFRMILQFGTISWRIRLVLKSPRITYI